MTKHKKIILIVLQIVVLLCLVGGGIVVYAKHNDKVNNMNNNEITEVVLSADQMIGLVEGKEIKTDKEYTKEILSEMLEGSRQMPAFGVALDNEVRVAKGKGLWLELIYTETIIFDEMPFERLLIEVGKDYTGFNLMRYHNGIYEGRCYYIDLVDKDMSGLYNYLIGLK